MYVPIYFTESEFEAVSCKLSDINAVSLARLDLARDIAGVPFIVNSAFRTAEQNRNCRGASNSAHLRGRAFDIACNSKNRWQIVRAAMLAGFTRIGVASSFIHMDDDPILPSPSLWLY